jgi:hypothetical protein
VIVTGATSATAAFAFDSTAVSPGVADAATGASTVGSSIGGVADSGAGSAPAVFFVARRAGSGAGAGIDSSSGSAVNSGAASTLATSESDGEDDWRAVISGTPAMMQITPRTIALLLIAHGEGLDRLAAAECLTRFDLGRRFALVLRGFVPFVARTTSSLTWLQCRN